MSKAFGTKFVIVNDVQQLLDSKTFGGGPWLHLATISRGFKEYCVFRHLRTNKMYMELVDPTTPGLFKQIEDPREWEALKHFVEAAQLTIVINPGKEIKVGKDGLPGMTLLE